MLNVIVEHFARAWNGRFRLWTFSNIRVSTKFRGLNFSPIRQETGAQSLSSYGLRSRLLPLNHK